MLNGSDRQFELRKWRYKIWGMMKMMLSKFERFKLKKKYKFGLEAFFLIWRLCWAIRMGCVDFKIEIKMWDRKNMRYLNLAHYKMSRVQYFKCFVFFMPQSCLTFLFLFLKSKPLNTISILKNTMRPNIIFFFLNFIIIFYIDMHEIIVF